MGLFDLFRRKEPAPEPAPDPIPLPAVPPAPRRFGFERERMFDIGRTHDLGQLFAIPRDQRGADWIEAFYDAAWWGSVELTEPQVFSGPDGFPYLRLNLPRPDTAFESQWQISQATASATASARPSSPARTMVRRRRSSCCLWG